MFLGSKSAFIFDMRYESRDRSLELDCWRTELNVENNTVIDVESGQVMRYMSEYISNVIVIQGY